MDKHKTKILIMNREQLATDINHILNSGANDIRLIELFNRYATQCCEQQRTTIDDKVHSICVEHEVNPSVMTLISKAVLETPLVV